MVDAIGLTFAALADPTRRAILERLSRGEATVTELARPFLAQMTLPAVTKHLQVLEKAGLVVKTREAQWRSCRLNPEPLRSAADWMEHYRHFWDESFDRLDEYLKSLPVPEKAIETKAEQKKPEGSGKAKHSIKAEGEDNEKV